MNDIQRLEYKLSSINTFERDVVRQITRLKQAVVRAENDRATIVKELERLRGGEHDCEPS